MIRQGDKITNARTGQVMIPKATVVKKAQDTFWGGYSGYFKDPDGHL